MNKLAKQLIALGYEKPSLRNHLRPILNKIASKAEPITKDRFGLPVYMPGELFDKRDKSALQEQEKAFNTVLNKFHSDVSGGRLQRSLGSILGQEVGEVRVEPVFTSDGMVIGDDRLQAHAMLQVPLLGDASLPGSAERDIEKLLDEKYGIRGSVSCGLFGMSVERPRTLVLEVTWMGASYSGAQVTQEQDRRLQEKGIKDPSRQLDLLTDSVSAALLSLTDSISRRSIQVSISRGMVIGTYTLTEPRLENAKKFAFRHRTRAIKRLKDYLFDFDDIVDVNKIRVVFDLQQSRRGRGTIEMTVKVPLLT